MSEQKGYGFVSDTDESLKTKSGGKFGLNTGAFLTKLEWVETTNDEGTVQGRLDVAVQIGEREYKTAMFPITKVYGKNSQELTDTESPEYQARFNADATQQSAVVIHYLKAVGVSEDAIKNALSGPISGFKEFADKLLPLLPVGYSKKPVDVFLEYQWTLGKKEDGSPMDVTFPVLPKNMKGGYFIVPAQPGNWEAVQDHEGLVYKNESGALHPIFRSKDFMESPKGTQQKLEDKITSTTSTPSGAPKKDEWM